MSFWKGIKEKIRIGVGHLRLVILGDTKLGEAHWDLEIRGYDRNIFFADNPLDHAIFGGDSGKPGPQLDAVLTAIKEYSPRQVFLLGDLGYPIGVTNEEEYQRFIKIPFGDLGPQHSGTLLIDGNHDEYGCRKERGFLSKKLFLQCDGKVMKPNFYGAIVYPGSGDIPPALVAWIDSTVYDVKLGDPEIQDRQHDFIEKLVDDPRFKDHKKIFITHHPVYSDGSHGDTNSSDFEEFFKEVIVGAFEAMASGHDHYTGMWGNYKGTMIFNVGGISKSKDGPEKKSVPGYLTYDAGKFKIKYVDYQPLIQDED